MRDDVGRVPAQQQRIHVPADDQAVLEARTGHVWRGIRRGMDRRLVQHDAERCRAAGSAHCAHRQPVAQQQVVRDLHRGGAALQSRCEYALFVPEYRHHPGLVVGCDGRYPRAEAACDLDGVVDERMYRVAAGPAALLLQRLRQVPVVQREVRGDAAATQALDQALVEGEARLVPCAAAERLHARPGNREAVGRDPQRCDQVEVGFEMVVVVAAHVAVAAVADRAGAAAEHVPDRVGTPVLVRGSLDLVRTGRNTPYEVARKAPQQRSGPGIRLRQSDRVQGIHREPTS